MDSFQEKLQEVLLPIATKLYSNSHLAALKNGMTITIPLMIIGGFAMLLAIPPVPADTTNALLLAWKSFATQYNEPLMALYNLSIGAISVFVVLGVSNSLAHEYKLDRMSCAITSLFLFWLTSAAPIAVEGFGQLSSMTFLGAQGMFYAIIVAFVTCDVMKFFFDKNIKIKMPEQVPPNVTAPFEALIPAVVLTLLFLIFNIICINLTGGNLAALTGNIVKPLISASSSLPAVIFLSILLSLFWFFGIHGNNMISGVLTPITAANLALNADYYINGVGSPSPLSGAFMTIFGNWMSYPAMMVCFFLIAKSAQLKSLRKIALVPDIFNINEPLTFGVPIVMNVLLALPIMIANVITCTIAYLVMSANLVNNIYITLPFTIPGIFNLFLGTGGDFRSIILWIVLFILDIIILLPFIKTYDNQLIKEENNATK
ncbi:MAG: PTS sugar transporter subunit IIC [Erysipelotrichaceae bacterium]|nr:PTS sugar transporter subunit IIC [Erysipelotrichaceae bacterium]